MQLNTSIPNMCPEGQHVHATLSMTILNYIEKIMVPFFHKVCFFKKWDTCYRMELCSYSEDAIARLPSKKPFSASFYQSGFL